MCRVIVIIIYGKKSEESDKLILKNLDNAGNELKTKILSPIVRNLISIFYL
jgi:hypothetical protein